MKAKIFCYILMYFLFLKPNKCVFFEEFKKSLCISHSDREDRLKRDQKNLNRRFSGTVHAIAIIFAYSESTRSCGRHDVLLVTKFEFSILTEKCRNFEGE